MKYIFTCVLVQALLLLELVPNRHTQAEAQRLWKDDNKKQYWWNKNRHEDDDEDDDRNRINEDIEVVPSVMSFGRTFEVEFFNPKRKPRWIGIYNKDDKKYDEDLLWSYLCGDQKSKYCSRKSGTIEFSVKGPYLKSHQYMPLNPGEYKVCK